MTTSSCGSTLVDGAEAIPTLSEVSISITSSSTTSTLSQSDPLQALLTLSYYSCTEESNFEPMPLFGRSSARNASSSATQPLTQNEGEEPPSYFDSRLEIFREMGAELRADGTPLPTPTVTLPSGNERPIFFNGLGRGGRALLPLYVSGGPTSVDASLRITSNSQIYAHSIGNAPANSHPTSNASNLSPPWTPVSSQPTWSPRTSGGSAGPSIVAIPTSPPARPSTSKFIFTPIPSSFGAATILIPAPATISATPTLDDTRPLYHISVTFPASILYPNSWCTMVRRGGSAGAGEIVAEWTVGMGDQSVVRMGELEMGVYYAFEASPKGGKRIWKFNPSARLVWHPPISTQKGASERHVWVCKLCKSASSPSPFSSSPSTSSSGTEVDIATFEPTHSYTPATSKSGDRRSQTVVTPRPVKPTVPPMLEVGEAGLRYLDELVVSVLVSEQMRLTPGGP